MHTILVRRCTWWKRIVQCIYNIQSIEPKILYINWWTVEQIHLYLFIVVTQVTYNDGDNAGSCNLYEFRNDCCCRLTLSPNDSSEIRYWFSGKGQKFIERIWLWSLLSLAKHQILLLNFDSLKSKEAIRFKESMSEILHWKFTLMETASMYCRHCWQPHRWIQLFFINISNLYRNFHYSIFHSYAVNTHDRMQLKRIYLICIRKSCKFSIN